MKKEPLTLYFLGDSHVGMFSGFDKIHMVWPDPHRDKWSIFKTFRIGANTAYNLANTKGDSYKKLVSVLKTLKKGSIVVLSYGEIDIRVHLLKQSLKQHKALKMVVDVCVDRYFKIVKEVTKLGYRVIIFEPTASSPVFVNYKEFITFGSVKERNLITSMFNLKLRSLARLHNTSVVSVNHKLMNSDMTTNHKYYFDPIHISSNATQFCLPTINQALSKWNLEIKYKFNFRQQHTLYQQLTKGQYIAYIKLKNFVESFLLNKKNIFNIDNYREKKLFEKYKKYHEDYYSELVKS